MLIDTHSHTYLCKHAQLVYPEAFLHVAKQMGFTHFVFCDHNPFPGDKYDLIHRMTLDELNLFNEMYEKQVRMSKEKDLPVPFKYLEVDWQPFDNQASIDFVNAYLADFDCVLGSLHFNSEQEKAFMESASVDEYLALFQAQWLAAVDSSLFQIMTHFDFFSFYNKKIYELIKTESGLKQIEDFVIQTVLKTENKNFLLEINTSAYKNGPEFKTFPTKRVISELFKQGVKFCVGSDSHFIKQVGQQFKSVFESLIEIGVTDLYYVEKKTIKSYKLADAMKLYKAIDMQEVARIQEEFKLK
ncbi:Histidinol-phosphatase [Hexamita inflata]|uniref:histidinol-phosphatase n=1 Tax=Hexamita inflata TaxID=28002 RepID=A0AA86UXC1_9EUKA|nr:Histidinol-phosphatase [Hexamita inflata]